MSGKTGLDQGDAERTAKNDAPPLKDKIAWPKALFVDLDNTLYDYTRASTCAGEALAALLTSRYKLDRDEVLQRYQAVSKTEGDETISSGLELRRRRIRQLLDSWPVTADIDEGAFVSAFGTALLSSVVWYQGARSALERFSSIMPVFIITESRDDIGDPILKALGLKSDKWRTLFTYRHNVSKRDGTAFLLALEWTKLKPDDVVMIGDNWTLDILGASRAGIRQIWKSDGKPLPDHAPKGFLGSVNHLHEAESLLLRSS